MTPQERTLLRTWLPVVALAELAGFAVPAVVGVLTVASPILVALPALIAAGIVEGAMLGAGQVLVLRHVLPAVSARRWVVATAGGAALAYLLGLLPSATGPLVATWPALVVGVVAAVMGVLLLGSVGTAQWLELRGHVDRAAVWIGVTALAWLLGLGAFLVIAIPLWQPGQAVWVTVLVGLVAGALMALVMATVTGVGLIRLLAGARPGGTPGVPSAPGRPTVVVGIDGSTGSRAALVDAMRSATRRGDRLQVVAVYEPPEWRMPSPPFAVPLPSRVEIETELDRAVRGMVTDVAYELGGEHRRRPQIDVVVRSGSRAEVLVDAARGADELVAGHRGRGSVASSLLGSVGRGCLLHAPCPVRVVPAGPPAPSPSGP